MRSEGEAVFINGFGKGTALAVSSEVVFQAGFAIILKGRASCRGCEKLQTRASPWNSGPSRAGEMVGL